jgi:hypothetical protein
MAMADCPRLPQRARTAVLIWPRGHGLSCVSQAAADPRSIKINDWLGTRVRGSAVRALAPFGTAVAR